MKKKEKLQPKVVAPVERPTTGTSIFNAQPNGGGIGASIPCLPMVAAFAFDDAE